MDMRMVHDSLQPFTQRFSLKMQEKRSLFNAQRQRDVMHMNYSQNLYFVIALYKIIITFHLLLVTI